MPAPAPARAPTPIPWLSILLPVFRVERYLADCARSLLAQDLDGVELLFLDDGSPDGSAAVLEQLAAREPARVRLLRHPHNRGQAAARNALLDEARGEWLWFVDPDDLVEPGAVARLRSIVGRHAPDLVMCDFRAFDDGDARSADRRDLHVSTFRGRRGVLSIDRDALVRGVFARGKLHAWSKVVRREAWPRTLRFGHGGAFQDLRVVSRLILGVRSWFHAADVWVAYRQRGDSIQGTMTLEKLGCWLSALAGYADELRAWEVAPRPATHLAVADYCARSALRAVELARRLDPASACELARRCGALWPTASGVGARELEWEYWRRGRFRRALRWRRWRRSAGL